MRTWISNASVGACARPVPWLFFSSRGRSLVWYGCGGDEVERHAPPRSPDRSGPKPLTHMRPAARQSSISPHSMMWHSARPARLRRSLCHAVQGFPSAESSEASTRRLATWRGRWPRRKTLNDRAAIANVSRCCSPILNVSSSSTDCDCGGRKALNLSSRWRLSRRTPQTRQADRSTTTGHRALLSVSAAGSVASD